MTSENEVVGVKPLGKVVIVGPTNVGKSTLFNRLTRSRRAIVCDRPGVTVDRHEMIVRDSPIGNFELIDTGGVGAEARTHPLGKEIERAAEEAVKTANVILFVVDGTQEPSLEIIEISNWLRKRVKGTNEQIVIVANKLDVKRFDLEPYRALGFSSVIGVSAENNLGIDDLWQILEERIGKSEEETEDEAAGAKAMPRLLVLGRPNVGKSTLLNSIIGRERHVVSAIPGTTRDPIETIQDVHGMIWKLCDTPGLRRPGRLERGVEWVAKEKLKDMAREADVALVVMDSVEGVTDQDASIAGMAMDFGLSVIIVFNKWDLMGAGQDRDDNLFDLERSDDLKMEFLRFAPRVRVSGLSGRGIPQLLKTITRIHEARAQRVQTAQLNKIFDVKFKGHSHPLGPKGRPAKFYYLSQVSACPPEFVLFSNLPSQSVHFSFRRYVVNTLRTEFGFEGTPIKLHFKEAR
jgi:GTP-binding protein